MKWFTCCLLRLREPLLVQEGIIVVLKSSLGEIFSEGSY